MPERLFIIDLYSLVFQVFHALPAMTSPEGQPTNAIFGFARDIRKILTDHQPDYLICAKDAAGAGIRNEWYPEYKANRSTMPEDLQAQIPLILEMLAGFDIPVLELPGWEADDIFATLAHQSAAMGWDVSIVTNDKDARQLLGKHVRLYNARKNQFIDEDYLMKDWGIRPDQVIEFQSLVGDSVDNVPGVPLVGPKKATALIQKFGTLEEVLAHADEAPGAKLRQNLKEFADQARISRQLVQLKTDLPLELDWEQARVGSHHYQQLADLFQRLGFRTLTDQMQQEAKKQNGETGESTVEAAVQRNWEVIDTTKRFNTFLAELKSQPHFCLDLETTSLTARAAEIVGWAISWQNNQGYYIPVKAPAGQKQLDADGVLAALKGILEDPQILKSNQNIKYDMQVLMQAGIRMQGINIDPMVGDYLLDAGARSHNLDTLAMRYLNKSLISITELIGKGKDQKSMADIDVEQVAEYASEDADLAWQLSACIEAELKKEKLWDLYWDLERPLIPVLAEMEFTGITVDTEELQQQSSALNERLETLVEEIYAEAGSRFNIDSPKQLRVILFDELNLPVVKKTKTGPSTDQSVLEQLAPLHPLPARITEHRQLSKLKSTYLDALPEMVNPDTNRIHGSFNQVVAATGRLSSSDPNLQNIPIRTEEGRRIRKAFVPSPPDWQLLCADYSQIELRMLAHFSEDPVMCAAFSEGVDIHAAVAAEIFDVDIESVDKDQRRVAKAVNFGVIYGQSPFGLSNALGISREEAARFIDEYFSRYAAVDRYLTSVLEECVESGYARTICGRRRKITGIKNTTGRQRNMPERTAINTVIQGSAADLIKLAMINIHRQLKQNKFNARMLLQIHDELVFEVPRTELNRLVKMITSEMESAIDLRVPLVIDVSAGQNWLEQAELSISRKKQETLF